MAEASKIQIEQFKENYCKSREQRLTIIRDFKVKVLSYEELLPGNTVRSYATGNREIDKGFIVFEVLDVVNDVTYNPVFSESVGRQLVKEWGLKLPSKMTVFTGTGNSTGGGTRKSEKTDRRKEENKQMLQLIRLARSMMIMHVSEPEPMREPFRSIYNKLEQNPHYEVWESDIKSINTAISNFFSKPVNKMNENFESLQQYISYLQKRYPDRHIREFDFSVLRDKMSARYPNETMVF